MQIRTIKTDDPLFDISYRRQTCSPLRCRISCQHLVFAVIKNSTGFRPVYGKDILEQFPADSEVNAAVIAPGTSEADLFMMFLLFETSVRRLNAAEKIRALKLAAEIREQEQGLETVMEYLGIRPGAVKPEHWLNIPSLGHLWLDLLAEDTVSVKTACSVLSFSESERSLLLSVFENMHLTVRMQELFISSIQDVLKVRTCSMEDLFDEWSVDVLYSDDEMHPKQKGRKLLDRVHRSLYPHLEQDRESFAALSDELGLKGGIQCTPDPFFEKDGIRFEFTASSVEEFREKAVRLAHIADNEQTPGLFGF